MKVIATLWIVLFVVALPHVGYSQGKGKNMIQGLTKAYESQCSGVTFELWYSPESDVAHMRDENPSDFSRDRVVMVVTNSQPPANRKFSFTEPKPLPGFARLLKQTEGAWIDISAEQVDPHHTGSASKVNMRFESVGDAYTSSIYYPAFTTITNPQNVDRGNYILRLAAFPYLEVEGQSCPMKLPDLPIRVR